MRPEETTITELEALIEGKSCMTTSAIYAGLGIPEDMVYRQMRILVADVMRAKGWVYRMHTPVAGEKQRAMWVNVNKLGVVDYRTVDGVYKNDEDVDRMILDTAEEMIKVHVDDLIERVGWDNPNRAIRRRITALLKRDGWNYQTVRVSSGYGKRWIKPTLMMNSQRLREIKERRDGRYQEYTKSEPQSTSVETQKNEKTDDTSPVE